MKDTGTKAYLPARIATTQALIKQARHMLADIAMHASAANLAMHVAHIAGLESTLATLKEFE